MYEFPYILAVNAGSSSIKITAYAFPHATELLAFEVEGIGTDTTHTSLHEKNSMLHDQFPASSHAEALERCVAMLRTRFTTEPHTISHRVVHGGTKHTTPTQVTPELLKSLEALFPLAPIHLPIQTQHVRSLRETFPHAQHIACFDTAFHAHMPRKARMTTLPRRFENAGVLRYGFHGLSYEYIIDSLRAKGSLPNRLIVAHLGNGASITAIQDGISVETSMGTTPSSGLLMSTRSGDIDPGVIGILNTDTHLDAYAFETMTRTESGLKGISETTGDMRTLLETMKTDPRAAEAVELFCYTVHKYIGSYAAVLNGVDMIVFTGGIGERSAYICHTIARGLEYLGVNLKNEPTAPKLTTDDSRVSIHMMHTDESATLCKHALQLLTL